MRLFSTLFFLMLLLSRADAQEGAGVRGDSPATRKRLADAEKLLLDGKAGEARDSLAKILETAGDDLILIEGGRYRAARGFAQRLLAKLPPEQLALYRDRVEEPARKLLHEGRDRRQTGPLLELLDRYAVSRPAEEALNLLGELAFERGEFARAERWWSRLVDAKSDVAYPGATREVAPISARRILAAHWQGDAARAGKLFSIFKQDHATATGRLAGHDGRLVEILHEELGKDPPLFTPLATDADWPMLGANPHRGGRVPGNLTLLAPTPTWAVPIPGILREAGAVIQSARSAAFHPVFDSHHVHLADANRIYHFSLNTGQVHSFGPEIADDNAVLTHGRRDADHTLTIAHGQLFARLGDASVIPPEGHGPASRLLALHGDAITWMRKPPVAEGILAGWEGAPLVVLGHRLGVFSHVEGGRLIQAIACYDDRIEKPLWVRDVCEAGMSAEPRERQELLTLAGSNVVFCSQSGVIAAANARTGAPAWSYRYPRVIRPPLDGRHRDLCPAVAAEGLVYAAPNDSDRLTAFDSETGRIVWQSGPILVDHLLGVAGQKVIAAIAGPQRGLRAYHAGTGSLEYPLGWTQHDDPGLATFGRGLIAGKTIAWPTQAGLWLIRLDDGLPARPLWRGVQGNLAYANGKLAVAGPRTLSLFREPVMVQIESPPFREKFGVGKPLRDIEVKLPIEPLLAALPQLTLKARAKRGEVFLPAAEWGRLEGEPALLATAEGADFVHYCGDDALTAEGPLLTRQSLAGKKIVWSRDMTVPIQTVRVSPAGSILLRLGEHQLAALDGTTGHTLWSIDSSKRPAIARQAIDSAAKFDEHFFLNDSFAFVHLSNDRVWLIENGQVVFEAPSPSGPWISPPILVNGGLVFASGPGSLAVLDLKAKKVFPAFTARNSASLAGIAPQLKLSQDFLDVVITRNQGCELDRLDAATLKSHWKQPAFLAADRVSLEHSCSNREMIVVPLEGRLVALRADTGVPLWDSPLPSKSKSAVHFFENALAAVPLGITSLAASTSESEPILLLDPATGRVKNRIGNYRGPILASTLTAEGLWLAAPQALYHVK